MLPSLQILPILISLSMPSVMDGLKSINIAGWFRISLYIDDLPVNKSAYPIFD